LLSRLKAQRESMLVMGNRGRPPDPGLRDERGRRRDLPDGRGDVLWHRSREEAVADWGDSRRADAIGKLELANLLTRSQIEAARLIARVYAAFERWHGQSRNPSAPGYIRTIISDQPDDAELLDQVETETPDDRDARQRRDDRRYHQLGEQIDGFGPGARPVLERLCCPPTEAPRSADLPSIKYALDCIAVRFHLADKVAQRDMRITARRPLRRARDRLGNHPDLAREAYVRLHHKRRPDVSIEDLGREWDELQDFTRALKDRARFLGQKRRR
jgi:hypothetical protein